MTEITTIQDAKAFKKMGIPLNTPVVERRVFSEAYSKQWFSLMKAHDDFCKALVHHIEAPSSTSKRLRKSLNGIAREVKRADIRSGKFEDPNEQMLMNLFLVQNAVPFIEYWADAFDALDDGETFEITEDNIRWVNKED